MTHEVIRREEARLLRIFEAYPVNGRKTNTGTIKMIREEIGNMTFRIARKCNVSVIILDGASKERKWCWENLRSYFRH